MKEIMKKLKSVRSNHK